MANCLSQVLFSLMPFALLAASPAPSATVDVEISGLRNTKGEVLLCLTRDEAFFPDCGRDPAAIKQTLSPAGSVAVSLRAIPVGAYALSIFHDENRNQRLDTFLKIPKEGFGFSRNPAMRFGPPRFSQVRFKVESGKSRQQVRIQYLL